MRTIHRPRTDPTCTAPRHGTEAAYTRVGCRCPEAREEVRIRRKRRRYNRYQSPVVDGTGVARRLQALAILGWTYHDMAARLDCSWSYVKVLADRKHPGVHILTVTKVRAMYRDLAGRPGTSTLSAARARAKGWQSPTAWGSDIDDPAAVPYAGLGRAPKAPSVNTAVDIDLVVAGHAPLATLSSATDRGLAVARMIAAGKPRNHIAREHRLSWTSLRKYLELGERVLAESREAVAA